MQHTIKQNTGYITHVHTQTMIVKMNSDTDIMLKDDRENIQASESMSQIN